MTQYRTHHPELDCTALDTCDGSEWHELEDDLADEHSPLWLLKWGAVTVVAVFLALACVALYAPALQG